MTVFTPTAPVLVNSIAARCSTDLVSAGGGTLSLGTAGTEVLAQPTAHRDFLVGTPITMDVLVGDVTGGVLEFTLEYQSIGGSTVS